MSDMHENLFKLHAKQPENQVKIEDITRMLNQINIPITNDETNHTLKQLNFDFQDYLTQEQFFRLIHYIQDNKIAHVKENDLISDFRCFDKEQTGYISASIVKNILHEYTDMKDYEITEAIKILDPDTNGNINYEFFVKKACSNFFKSN